MVVNERFNSRKLFLKKSNTYIYKMLFISKRFNVSYVNDLRVQEHKKLKT